MSESFSYVERSGAGTGASPARHRASVLLRLLVRVYPRWFRAEFGSQLLAHLARQRTEIKYSGRWGGARFWRDAGADALRAGFTLRMERVRERLSKLWRGRRASSDRYTGGGPTGRHDPETGGALALLDALRRDLRDALRGLIGNPGYSLVFILTLGLGIGANTAMFSAVNGVLLRPLPHEDGERLVYLRHRAALADVPNALFSVPEIDDYRRGAPSLGAVAEFSAMDFTMLGYDVPRRVRAGIVTGNYFHVMGLKSTLGRLVGPEDAGPEAPSVVVLSDAYFRSFFGGDTSIIGTTVEINGRTATFVGVAEPAPPYPERTDIYVNLSTSPHHMDASMQHDRVHRMTEVFARLAPGATVESAAAEIEAISSRIHSEFPEAYDAGSGYEVTVTPLKTQLTSRARPALLLALATASLVLVIACANLANLTLTRVLRRGHELAIRVSLGGSRAALRRGLLVESLVLAVAGAAVGVVMAYVGLDLLVRFTSRFTSRASEITLDANVFGFALLAAVGASIFFTVLPPLPGYKGVRESLSGSRSTAGSGAKRIQRVLVVAQIGVSFVLLIGAGLLLRTMFHLESLDPGFDQAQVLSMSIPQSLGQKSEVEMREQFLGIRDEVTALPGVERVALTSSVPFLASGFPMRMELAVDGHEPTPGAPAPRADFRVVSPGYFATMGIELLRGREFVSTDLEDSQGVVILNESMARAYFGDRDPIGQRIAWTDPVFRFIGLYDTWRTVVGVVADTRDRGLDTAAGHAAYNPYRQVHPMFTDSVVMRLSVEPATVLPAVREIVLRYDPEQPIVDVATLADLGDDSVAGRRLNAILLGAFALLALVIASVGIAGVLAFSVGSRTREFGVRSALGAAPRQVWSGVVVEGAKLASIGVVLGTFVAIALARSISGLLVGVPALDPLTFLGVGVLLVAVAVVAAWTPAWRAAAVSPLEALNAD